MAANNARIILVTNLWTSFLLTKDYSNLDNQLKTEQTRLLFSEDLLEELSRLPRPKLKIYISKNDVEDILATIEQFAEFIHVKAKVSIAEIPNTIFY